MKSTQLTAVAFSVIFVTGCSSILTSQTDSLIKLNYKTENAKSVGVVQVFDLGSNTVVQMKDIDRIRPIFLDKDNKELKYKVFGQNAVLSGIHDAFRVVTATATSDITRDSENQIASSVSPPLARKDATEKPIPNKVIAAHINDSPDKLVAEINRMKKELGELKTMLAQMSAQEQSHLETKTVSEGKVQVPLDEDKSLEQSTVIVQFKDNSYTFEPTPAVQTAILEQASSAKAIAVKGYTDSFTPTAKATSLAKRRALAAKNYLISNGVKNEKISVQYYPNGGFISDNHTKEGKAANRRVEIAMSS